MGRHQGYVVQQVRGRWQARPWNPATKKYEAQRRFDTEGQAKTYGKAKHAEFITRRQVIAREAVPALIEKYLAEMERRKRSASHRTDVRLVLERFAAKIKDLSHPNVYAQTVEWLAGFPDHSPATRNRYIVTVRALCKWAMDHGHITEHPLRALYEEAEPDTLKEQFTLEEMRKMVRAFDDPYHRRCCLQLYAGLRADEAAHIEAKHIDFEGRILDVKLGEYRLKRQKERHVILQTELALILTNLPEKGPIAPKTQVNLWREFCYFLDRLEIKKRGRSPHSLRHGFAGLMTAIGTPTDSVRTWMGHRTAQTTAGYTKMATRYVEAVKDWPRNQFQLLVGATSPLALQSTDKACQRHPDDMAEKAQKPAELALERVK